MRRFLVSTSATVWLWRALRSSWRFKYSSSCAMVMAPSKRNTTSGQYFSSMVIIDALLMIAGGTASVSRRGAVSALDEHGGEVGLGEIERGAAGRFAHHAGGDELGDRRQRAEVGGPARQQEAQRTLRRGLAQRRGAGSVAALVTLDHESR